MNRYGIFAITLLAMLLALSRPGFSQVNTTIQSIESAFQTQSIDRPTKILYQLYTVINPGKIPAEFRSTASRNQPIKCATPFVQEYHQHREEFSATAVQEIDRMMSAAKLQPQQYASASGRFTIFYETADSNAVPSADANGNAIPDYVEWTAAAADSSWRHEVQTLGYSNPVTGSTTPYPIYIEDLGASGTYGFTSPGANRGFPESTYIVINSQLDQAVFTQNDHPNPARGAVNVTIAHELKHAIQYANSEWHAINDSNNGPHSVDWSEMDATYMEETVYDNVNDYYHYIMGDNSIFSNDHHTIPVAYAGVSWFIHFDEFYEPAFWVRVWERIRQQYEAGQNQPQSNFLTMPEAVSTTLSEDYDDTFPNAYSQSHLWHFASGSLAAPNFGFSERNNYPTPTINFNLAGRDSLPSEQTIGALSAEYIEVDATLSLPGIAVITLKNTEPFTTMGVLAYFNDGNTEFKTYRATEDGLKIDTGWKWDQLSRMGIVVANSSTSQSTTYMLRVDSNIPEEIVFDPNYPNPFSQQTTIPLSLPEDAHVQVKVFDITGRLVETMLDEERKAGKNPLTFDADGLASGIYFVQVIIDGQAFVQKMTLIK